MDFKAVCAVLKEKNGVVAYWRDSLKQHELIEPKKGRGNKDIFREEDVLRFVQLQQYLNEGVPTVSEAIRLMKNNITPTEAYERFQQAQRQIEVLQKKVVQLRKPFWKKVQEWVKNILSVFRTKTKDNISVEQEGGERGTQLSN